MVFAFGAVWLWLGDAPFKSFWPTIRSTVSRAPVCEKGAGYRNIRLFPASTTYRLPCLSTAMASGAARPVVKSEPGPFEAVEKKSRCPITLSAKSPLVKALAFFHARMRLLPVSAT